MNIEDTREHKAGYLTASHEELQAEAKRMGELCREELDRDYVYAFEIGMMNAFGLCQAEYRKVCDHVPEAGKTISDKTCIVNQLT